MTNTRLLLVLSYILTQLFATVIRNCVKQCVLYLCHLSYNYFIMSSHKKHDVIPLAFHQALLPYCNLFNYVQTITLFLTNYL